MRRLVLALLVCLAGCSGLTGIQAPTTPTGTVTPAPVPEDVKVRTPVVSPPGALRGGLDARALAQGHAETLDGANYTWVVVENRSAPPESAQTEWVEATRFARVAEATEYRAQTSTVYRRPGLAIRVPRTATYADGETVYVRDERVSNRPATYTRWPARWCSGGEGVNEDAAERLVERYLSVGRSTIERVEGERGVRFEVAGVGSLSLTGVENYVVAATVTPDGRVERLRATFRENGTRVTVSFRYGEVGTTAAPPPFWYGAARERATATASTACRPDCSFPGGRTVGDGRCLVPTPEQERGSVDPAYSSPRMPGSVILTGASTSSASSGER